jgi:hypothetical protein
MRNVDTSAALLILHAMLDRGGDATILLRAMYRLSGLPISLILRNRQTANR